MGRKDVSTPAETPLPYNPEYYSGRRTREHTKCRYPDAEVLLEDVRMSRKRRWWITTFAISAFCGSIITLVLLIFNIGQAVGAAQRDITQIKSIQVEAKVEREGLRRDQVEAQRVTNDRYGKINGTLIRLEEQLKTLNKRMDDRTGGRRR
jgi:hypothetical protein